MTISDKKEVQKEAWDKIWAHKPITKVIIGAGRKVYNLFFLNFLSKYLKQNSKMVEIGCGGASLSVSIAHKIDSYTGIDYSEEAITLAKKNTNNMNNVKIIYQNALNLDPGLLGKFDVVWSSGLVEHFPTYGPIIEAHYKLAAPGGVVLISVPYKYSYHTIWYKLTRPKPFRRFWPWENTNAKFLTKNDLLEVGKKLSPSAKIKFLPPKPIGFLLGIIILELNKPSDSEI